ncbi:MAG TPA: glycoside hydrolase family 16 protein, partial [Polyangia bacterium]|nr:glycoside hydrolase family 16 protein [Polyangia bacterium]
APGGAGSGGDAPAEARPSLDGGAGADAAAGDAHARYDGAPTVPPALAGWSLVWSDEFEETAVDESVWNILDVPGTQANAELQYYTPRKNDEPGANVYLEDGALVIEAREEAWKGYAYTSARLNTQLGTKQFEYGRFEARIKMPDVTGLWPAFWMLGVDSPTARWPTDGEIDIMEGKGRLPSWVAGSLHRASMPGAAYDIVSTKSYTLPSGNFHDAWHTFAVEWDAQHVSWFVDDTLYETVTRPTAATEPWPFDQKFYILLNLAVGGLFDANAKPPAGMPPQRLVVDYVRVYQKP